MRRTFLLKKINEMICKGRERCLSSMAAVNGKSQRNGNISEIVNYLGQVTSEVK